MSSRELRKQALDRMRSLPPDRLQVAVDFLAYLEERASDEATQELLRIPGIERDMKAALRTSSGGKGVPWRKVRRDV